VRVEETPIARLRGAGHTLEAIDLIDGRSVPCAALFTHPPQQQVGLVRALVASHGLALDADGLVKTDPMTRETSVAGIYAAGDLTTRQQGAILAAAAATLAATMVNVELTSARVLAGEL
jgi:thioredoxin reductase